MGHKYSVIKKRKEFVLELGQVDLLSVYKTDFVQMLKKK